MKTNEKIAICLMCLCTMINADLQAHRPVLEKTVYITKTVPQIMHVESIPKEKVLETETEHETEPETEPTTEPETEPLATIDEPADYIVQELTNEGYSAHAIAGILGNCMAECGGQTLNLHPAANGNGFYGICQWSSYYYPSVQGTSLDVQVDFLISTIETEFDTFGSIFGCSYEEFKSINDERRAALMFAKIYERCAEGSYGVRQNNASDAYEHYFC